MANSAPRKFGITDPLSTALPTDAENQASVALVDELRRQNNYESTAETNKRTIVLQSLQAITEEFVKQATKAQGKNERIVNSAGGKIFTYGSFRLGVYGPGSDIDTLVVVPKYISRDEYFDLFPDLLVKMAPEGAITDLTVVKDAFVPIIKFEYSDISIDLIFSRVPLNQVPKDLTLTDDSLLKDLDDSELRSVNGTRVTDMIMDVVPEKGVFRTALRAIKLWAQRRAIYANIMGFPGGVAWAMLVARVCQLYPHAASATIVLKFFRIMEKWQWPQPVLLKQIVNGPLGSKVRVWNPRVYKGDSFHIMPIITPAYPSMCATHNITYSTKKIIQRELVRGGNITDQIMMGKFPWKDLFGKHTFFTKDYKYYLSVISASTTKEAQLIWSGLVESKVRHLVVYLEGHDSIAVAHPFNKGFERTHKCNSEEEVERVKEGDLQFQVKDVPTETTDSSKDPALAAVKHENGEVKNENGVVKDENGEVKAENGGVKAENGEVKAENGEVKPEADTKVTTVYTTTFYIGLELQDGAKSLDLSWQVDEFKALCMKWDKYSTELNALSVINARNCDLPDDVFTEGEIKPSRPQKKKKRTATDDVPQAPSKRQQVVAAG